jgi:DNA (cytosine-5)-methyltransferase 1
LVDAADFGVPQTRKRLIFIGLHRDLGLEPPVLQGSGASTALTLLRDCESHGGYQLGLRDDAVAEELLERLRDPNDPEVVSAQQAIGDLIGLAAGRREDVLPASEIPAATSAYQQLMRRPGRALGNVSVPRINADTVLRLNGIPAGGNYRDLAEKLQARYLTGQKWGPSTGSDQLARKHYYAYRRLHPDIWAWTLNTKADAVYHFTAARALSVREFGRLQSFPDDFVITTDPRRGEISGRVPNGATHSKYRQIGNAVPPRLAEAIGQSIAEVVPAQTSLPVA